jgi:hypothetical protein
MNRQMLIKVVLGILACAGWSGAARRAQAQAPQTRVQYPQMAPLDQYLIANPDDEIALAKTAAPSPISSAAGIVILDRKGYHTAVKGENGFVCIVQRSWTAGFDDPEFWNPKIRSPICFNPAGVRTYLPIVFMKTDLALAGQSKEQIRDAINTAFDNKKLPALEPGAMCYMMSKEGHLSDRDGHWYPHLMFFVPIEDPSAWGANLDGSPVLGAEDKEDRLIIFLIPVGRWSDGTSAPAF